MSFTSLMPCLLLVSTTHTVALLVSQGPTPGRKVGDRKALLDRSSDAASQREVAGADDESEGSSALSERRERESEREVSMRAPDVRRPKLAITCPAQAAPLTAGMSEMEGVSCSGSVPWWSYMGQREYARFVKGLASRLVRRCL